MGSLFKMPKYTPPPAINTANEALDRREERADASEKRELDSQLDVYPEESIYMKFAPDHDNRLMPEFHKVEWNSKYSVIQKFKDERMQYFGKKILYEEKKLKLDVTTAKSELMNA